MTEEKKGLEQQKPEPTEPTPPQGDDTVQIRKGEYDGLKTQIRQAKKDAAELAARLAEFDKAKQAEQADKLKAAEKFGELDKKYQDEAAKLSSEIAGLKRSTLVERARNALLASGMRPGLAIDGAVSALPTEFDSDGIADWVAQIKERNPGEFGAPVAPIAAPSAGAAARPGGGNDADAIRREWEAARSKGPDALIAVKRKVDLYMRNTGKNPLA